jgi:hypothetical protein
MEGVYHYSETAGPTICMHLKIEITHQVEVRYNNDLFGAKKL